MIRILVVDDSPMVRRLLTDLLTDEEGFSVVGTAVDGKDALDKVNWLQPDVVLMDIHMPSMDGVEAVKRLMRQHPLPIILFSARSARDSVEVLEALRAGAVDFILKPEQGLATVREELVAKIKGASRARVASIRKLQSSGRGAEFHAFTSTSKKIILIGTSTGGPQTLERLLPEIPKNIPAPILIVQHMPPVFTRSLANRLDLLCDISVKEAKDGDPLENGVAFLAPGGQHMEIGFDKGHVIVRLNDEPSELGVRPSVNKLFRSVAALFGDKTIAVVLTGMGHDGTDGAKLIKELGGTVIVQDESSSIIFGMPKSIIQSNLADEVVGLDKMSVALIQLMDV